MAHHQASESRQQAADRPLATRIKSSLKASGCYLMMMMTTSGPARTWVLIFMVLLLVMLLDDDDDDIGASTNLGLDLHGLAPCG